MLSEYFDLLRRLCQPIRAAAWEQTLDPMHHLLATLGNPQEHFRSVVVTGSTGKGSTCLRLAEMLSSGDLKIGLYLSPHLHLFRERFSILDSHNEALRIITQSEFVEIARMVLDAASKLDHRYSTFEYATAIALVWFAQQKIDSAVLEVGIGGRFDAVNAVENVLALFTPIETEHVAMLGGSLESVAWHKAGIIRQQAISVPQVPEVLAVLEREAQEKGASLAIVDDLLDGVRKGGFGANLRFASRPSLPNNHLPGRLERIAIAKHDVIIDGGHTPTAARCLRRFIDAAPTIRLIVGMLRDKDAAAYLSVFDARNVHFVYTRAPGDRALSPEDLLARYQPTQARFSLEPSLDEALKQVETAAEALIVVAGSLRMAAAAREAFGLLSRDDLEEAQLTRAIFEGAEYRAKIEKS